MTQKRFTINGKEIIQDKQVWCMAHSEHCADVIATAINELIEENEQLKQINRNLGDFRNFITKQNVLNEKQRKELQLQMLRLYNYFENWFEDIMSSNDFSEMWDNVKEDKKWEKKWYE